ncbi:ribokinase [Carnimonas nigrificans]|uniref:ribokinase n=1 Tax=Carnimonas nigrificans TaxID=64323 RepID=UPI00047075EA|nr:ribokinase [Carnimonas nigrificans]
MIYNFGSINIDNVYRVPHLVAPGETLASLSYSQILGGKGSNQSLAIARAGAEVSHIGAIAQGDSWIGELLEASGVNTDHLALLDDVASGHTFIQVDNNAENCIVLYPGANHAVPSRVIDEALGSAKAGDWLLAQNECGDLSALLDKALDKGLKVALNPAPMNDAIAALPLNRLSVLCVNRGEAVALLSALNATPDADTNDALLAALMARFPEPEIILTLGSDGVLYGHGNCHIEQAIFKVNARDTTGAGDTFVGYYLAAREAGLDAAAALTRARAASALCVQKEGASSSIPKYNDVDRFHEQHNQ